MVAGREVAAADTRDLCVVNEKVENVFEFTYLGSLMSANGRVGMDIDRRIA